MHSIYERLLGEHTLLLFMHLGPAADLTKPLHRRSEKGVCCPTMPISIGKRSIEKGSRQAIAEVYEVRTKIEVCHSGRLGTRSIVGTNA